VTWSLLFREVGMLQELLDEELMEKMLLLVQMQLVQMQLAWTQRFQRPLYEYVRRFLSREQWKD
jgi:hypothetical protein